MKKFAFLFSALIILFLFIQGCGSKPSTPEDLVKDFMKKVENNDKGAIDYISKSTVTLLGKEKIDAGIEKQSEQIKQKGGIKEIVFGGKKEKKDGILELRYEILFNDGTSKKDKVFVVKEDGDWKITASK
ncbi:MAG: DUF4878 domain-containing protein [Ignavibacteriaceae bacterium]|nr:DUF4878 domain-containing protein [Ignavibacteriaceae bacterium]